MTIAPERDLEFPLLLRIPEWCTLPDVRINGRQVDTPTNVKSRCVSGFLRLERTWRRGDAITLRFPMRPRLERVNDLNAGGKAYCGISYGPLCFAYGLPEIDENTPVSGARTDWTLDPRTVWTDVAVECRPMPSRWNWPLDAPVKMRVMSADGSPLELVPYGCTRLRMALFPVADWRFPISRQ